MAESRELQEARDAVAAEKKELDRIGTPGSHGEGVLNKQLVMYQAAVNRLIIAGLRDTLGDLQDVIGAASLEIRSGAENIHRSVGILDTTITKRVTDFTERVDKMAAANDATTRALVGWTKGLVFVTGVLALFTAIMALEALHQLGWF